MGQRCNRCGGTFENVFSWYAHQPFPDMNVVPDHGDLSEHGDIPDSFKLLCGYTATLNNQCSKDYLITNEILKRKTMKNRSY